MDDAMIAATALRPNEEEGPDEHGSWVPAWLRIGHRNPWIRGAGDPPFTADSFREVRTVNELEEYLGFGNWATGSAFYLGDLAFINQVNGGGEWLVIRRGIPFESLTYPNQSGPDGFRRFVERVQTATDDQLRNLEY